MTDAKDYCICSKCKKRFEYKDAVPKTRMLYNKMIEEKSCPYCGCKGFSRMSDLYELSQITSHHRYGQ